MAALWAGHLPGRPGQTAHFHGREGTFSLPPIQPPSATPWLSSVLAPSSRARLVPVYLRQAPPGPTQLQEASRQQLSENPEAACKTAMLALSLVILSLLSAVLPASCQQAPPRETSSYRTGSSRCKTQPGSSEPKRRRRRTATPSGQDLGQLPEGCPLHRGAQAPVGGPVFDPGGGSKALAAQISDTAP
ncbi:PDZK1-interacting protein 1 isoform X2 [Cavia porcellus]|uniref:PDZK1-interacting protein 1 isoform X2 n=1 Tax=Cavia porcellus TaxID=10141 RepID=UPI000661EE33|nr:PDZK1-interacting protein 1 isoform X2 [Cavia porcellus]